MNIIIKITASILAVPYVIWLIFAYQYHFIDGANLVFHEAGHMIFLIFGRTIHFLGGTIGQLAFPTICCIGFYQSKQKFEFGVCGLWFGENIMNIAWYMGDAKTQIIPLVGGGIHDWHWLFSKVGLLSSCKLLAAFVHFLGAVILVCSVFVLFHDTFIIEKASSENKEIETLF